MTPDAQARHARESLLVGISRGEADGKAIDGAVRSLAALGVPIADARVVVQRVWDERFRVWGPC